MLSPINHSAETLPGWVPPATVHPWTVGRLDRRVMPARSAASKLGVEIGDLSFDEMAERLSLTPDERDSVVCVYSHKTKQSSHNFLNGIATTIAEAKGGA